MQTEAQTTDNGIILLDIGNTNLKWAWLQGGRPGEISTIWHRGEDIGGLADRELSAIKTPGQVYISSVVGKALESDLSGWIRQHWGCEPVFIRASAQACGVSNAYREPERLGVDRWLSMLALHAQSSGPICVVDCGTAVTIDVLAPEGRHLGGLILPGFGLMRQALVEHTSIAFTEGAKPTLGMLAADTETAIASGGVHAVAALVEQIVQKVAAEYSTTLDLVLTGGDAQTLQLALSTSSRIDVDLVMQGMAEMIKDEAIDI